MSWSSSQGGDNTPAAIMDAKSFWDPTNEVQAVAGESGEEEDCHYWPGQQARDHKQKGQDASPFLLLRGGVPGSRWLHVVAEKGAKVRDGPAMDGTNELGTLPCGAAHRFIGSAVAVPPGRYRQHLIDVRRFKIRFTLQAPPSKDSTSAAFLSSSSGAAPRFGWVSEAGRNRSSATPITAVLEPSPCSFCDRELCMLSDDQRGAHREHCRHRLEERQRMQEQQQQLETRRQRDELIRQQDEKWKRRDAQQQRQVKSLGGQLANNLHMQQLKAREQRPQQRYQPYYAQQRQHRDQKQMQQLPQEHRLQQRPEQQTSPQALHETQGLQARIFGSHDAVREARLKKAAEQKADFQRKQQEKAEQMQGNPQQDTCAVHPKYGAQCPSCDRYFAEVLARDVKAQTSHVSACIEAQMGNI